MNDRRDHALHTSYLIICAGDRPLVPDIWRHIGQIYLRLHVRDIAAPRTLHGLPVEFPYWWPRRVPHWQRNQFLRAVEAQHPRVSTMIRALPQATKCELHFNDCDDESVSFDVYIDDLRWGYQRNAKHNFRWSSRLMRIRW
jgi:hypothetical protein